MKRNIISQDGDEKSDDGVQIYGNNNVIMPLNNRVIHSQTPRG